MKYYDKKNNRLVFVEKKASNTFWDNLWNKNDFIKIVKKWPSLIFFKRDTAKYLKPNKNIKILEWWCGMWQNVYRLDKWGYDSYWVDFAKKTIQKVKENFPNLQLKIGDVRKLPYKNNFFDWYWSLWVIEHFYNWYDEITSEMNRVLKKWGYLFITFPHMSKLRRLKTKLWKYKNWTEHKKNMENFYQFALDEKKVIADLEKEWFKFIKKKPINGFKWLQDEINFLHIMLKKINKSKFLLLKIIKYTIYFTFSFFSSHIVLIVLKKK